MHRSLSSVGVLSIGLAVLAAPLTAGAQARVAEQKIVGPPAPEAVLAGAPAAAPERTSGKKESALSPMESALRIAVKDLRAASRKGMLVDPSSGARISAGASDAVLAVMSSPSGEAEAQLRNALMMSGNSRDAADHLMLALPELASEPNTNHVRSARKSYDAFMTTANESFRVNPPAEVMAIDAALARLSAAETGVRDDERARKEEQKARKSQPRKNNRKAAADEKKRAAEAKKAAEKEKKRAAADEKKRAAEDKKRADEEKKAAEKRAAEEKKAAEKAAKDKSKAASK
jgi:hypothetical protein